MCWRTCPACARLRWFAKTFTLSKILTKEAFENAIRVNAAIGGSTNAVIHLKAIAGRIGVELDLDDWTRIGRGMPTIVDLQPSGVS
jgi:L-arabonate dehydrase